MKIERLEFQKYHGLGNDYVILDDRELNIPDEKKGKLAERLCEFHFSIGADGLIYVCNSEDADIWMRIFNDDGTEAEMCGNGIRCFSKYIYENGIVQKDIIKVETGKGILEAKLSIQGDIVQSVEIDIGAPILKCKDVPVVSDSNEERCIEESLEILDTTFQFTAVSMGNPHAVIFVDEMLEDEDLIKYGSRIEVYEKFPNKVNVEFVKVISDTEGQLRVFERGVGITHSCGTGTCAAVVAGTLLDKFKKNTPVVIHNDGGDLTITYTGETVYMKGPIEKVFTGHIDQLEIK
ncbi:MAG: diaminopimelate epimerase [Promethearchaeia archaeon]